MDGGNKRFTMIKLDKHTFMSSRSTPTIINHVDGTYTGYMRKTKLYFYDLPPPTHNPRPIMRKLSDKFQEKGTLQYS